MQDKPRLIQGDKHGLGGTITCRQLDSTIMTCDGLTRYGVRFSEWMAGEGGCYKAMKL